MANSGSSKEKQIVAKRRAATFKCLEKWDTLWHEGKKVVQLILSVRNDESSALEHNHELQELCDKLTSIIPRLAEVHAEIEDLNSKLQSLQDLSNLSSSCNQSCDLDISITQPDSIHRFVTDHGIVLDKLK